MDEGYADRVLFIFGLDLWMWRDSNRRKSIVLLADPIGLKLSDIIGGLEQAK